MPDLERKLTPEMQQTIADPNPTVVAIEKLINDANGNERSIEMIVRGYIRNAIYVFQRHMVTCALRDLDLKKDDLSEELVAQIVADAGEHMGKFRDWFLLELNRANGIHHVGQRALAEFLADFGGPIRRGVVVDAKVCTVGRGAGQLRVR